MKDITSWKETKAMSDFFRQKHLMLKHRTSFWKIMIVLEKNRFLDFTIDILTSKASTSKTVEKSEYKFLKDKLDGLKAVACSQQNMPIKTEQHKTH